VNDQANDIELGAVAKPTPAEDLLNRCFDRFDECGEVGPELVAELEALDQERPASGYEDRVEYLRASLEKTDNDPNKLLKDLLKLERARRRANAVDALKYLDTPEPEPVLWAEGWAKGGSVLRTGEVTVLSGAGGAGKSYLTLQLALAACREGSGNACGFQARTDRAGAVLIGYEDAPETVAARLRLVAGGKWAEGLRLFPDPDPLMQANPDRSGEAFKSVTWSELWGSVRESDPSLVVVDPASAALSGANLNDGGTVRRFVRALSSEAKRGGFGVLLVAHSTKEARYGKEDPGPGAVAGSGQWWDSTRAVLYMQGAGPDKASVEVLKCNYGPTGWAVMLKKHMEPNEGRPDTFRGWHKLDRFSAEEWKEHRRQMKGAAKSNGKKRTNGETWDPDRAALEAVGLDG